MYTDVIYKIPCNDCEDVFIGETKLLLSERLNQHARDVRQRKENTALAKHAVEEGHNFNTSDVTTTARGSSVRR